jgi:sortase A
MAKSSSSTPRSTARRAAGVVGELLITAGVVLLLFVAWQLWWTDIIAGRAYEAGRQELRREWGIGSPDGALPASVDTTAGQPFGLIYIPRLRARAWGVPVIEGTDYQLLTEGFGHHESSALPGEVGNFAIAGHRTTYGAPLAEVEDLRAGDQVIVETASGWYVYELDRHEIIDYWEGWILDPVPGRPRSTQPTQELITMYACHPRFSAAQRYVWFGRLVDEYPKSQATPPAIQRYGKA